MVLSWITRVQQRYGTRVEKQPLRVAVVDDDFRILESLDDLLAAAGYEVMLFESGENFLNANCTDQIACLISDIGMPRMNGWDLVRTARARKSDLPVILITGRENERTASGVSSSSFRLFQKPFDGVELLEALAVLISTEK